MVPLLRGILPIRSLLPCPETDLAVYSPEIQSHNYHSLKGVANMASKSGQKNSKASISITKSPGSVIPTRSGLRSGVQPQDQEATSKEIDKPAQAAVEKSKLLVEQEMKDTSDSEGDTLEDLEQITVGMVWCHVLFGRMYADHKGRIMNRIGEMIRDSADFPEDCIYVADFEQSSAADSDLLKIYVSFESEELLEVFQRFKVVEISIKGPEEDRKLVLTSHSVTSSMGPAKGGR
jgi:hypothetical protein